MLNIPQVIENYPAYETTNWLINSSCLIVFKLNMTSADFGLYNHVSQCHITYPFILVLFLWRTLMNTRSLSLGGPKSLKDMILNNYDQRCIDFLFKIPSSLGVLVYIDIQVCSLKVQHTSNKTSLSRNTRWFWKVIPAILKMIKCKQLF